MVGLNDQCLGVSSYGGCETHEWPSLEPMFGLSILGYYRNMVVEVHGRGPAPSIDRLRAHFKVTITQQSHLQATVH